MRTSSYTIYVDLPGDPEEMLLVQTYTGAFDKVSRRVASFVRSREIRKAPKPLYGDWTEEMPIDGEVPPPSDETIQALKRRGYLTTMTPEEEEEFFHSYVEKLHEMYSKRRPTYMVMPNYDCNLRCSYCFQDHMRTNPEFRHLLTGMKPQVVDRIFQAILQIDAMHGLQTDEDTPLEIGLFGGEPLLSRNRPIIDYIVEKGRAQGEFRMWAISNGTQLEAYEDLLAPDCLNNIQITLDGPPAEHDKRRIHADGSGSWDKIVRNIDMALDRGVRVAIRTNADRNNLSDLVELAEQIVDRGWDKYPNFFAQVATIRASNDQTDSKTTLNTWDLDRHLTEMRKQHPVVRVLGTIDDSMRNQVHRLFTKRGLPAFKPSFCSAHTGMYIFDAFADIYACWEKTGDKRIRIGHVDETGEPHLNTAPNAQWRSRHVASNPICLKCRYNLFCGGGCAILAQDHNGGFYRNYCDGFAHRFRNSVAEAFTDFARGTPLAAGLEAFCDV